MKHVIVLVTAKDPDEAEKIAHVLLDKKLAACCNIVKDIRSFYRWQGKICDDTEVLMVIKTRQDLFKELEKEVRASHGYSVPEIIALPIVEGRAPYLQWMDESLKLKAKSLRLNVKSHKSKGSGRRLRKRIVF